MTVQTEKTARATTTVDTPSATKPAPNRSRTPAAERAYARRGRREGHKANRPAGATGKSGATGATIDEADHGAGRASFVVLIIALLTVGVAATLWLSTQAIADSYRLDQAKQDADRLAERAAHLQREVTEDESASSLAERAKAMGMIPAGDPARLVVQPDGTVVVVGDPTPVEKPAPPVDPQQPPAGTGTTPPAGTPPAGTGTPPGAG
jgi:hypothetical protein